MIFSRLKREWATWTLLWWLPIAAVLGIWIFGMCRYAGSEIGPIPFDDMTSGTYFGLFLTWMLMSIALLAAGANQRCSGLLDLALPLDPRRLWLGHMAAVMLPLIGMLTVAMGIVAVGNGLSGIRPLVQPGLLSFGLHIAGAFVLALALLQSSKPSLFRIRYTRGYALLTIFSIAGVLGLVVLLGTVRLVFVLIPFGAALLLFVRIYCRLPASFSLVPLEPDCGDLPDPIRTIDGALDRTPPAEKGSFWLVHSTIWRSAIGNWTWVFPVAFGYHGLVLSMSFTVDEGRGTAFVYLFFTWSILSCWLLLTIRRLYVLDALPISRHRIFAVFVVTALVCLAAGYGVGVGIGAAAGDFPPQIKLEAVDCCSRIQIPHEYRQIAWDGTIPPSIAPWGEEALPVGIPLFKGGGASSYSPFDIAPDSSVDFVAWQLGRAVEAVYGETIAAGVIRDRYLAVGPEGRVQPRNQGFGLLEDHGELESGAGTGVIPVVFLVVALPWMIFGALIYRSQRGRSCGTLWLAGAIGGFVLVLLVGMVGLAADSVGLLDLVAFSDLFAVLVRTLYEVLPGGGITVWAGAIVLFAGGYLLARKEFQSLEAPVERSAKG